jgi:hypothetical protein
MVRILASPWVLDSSTEAMAYSVAVRAARKSGPTSKVQKVFDEVARLPRRQQEKIVEVVSALMTQYEQSRQ